MKGADAAQQRQGEQQPADELAGHIARQRIVPAGERPLHGQARRALRKAEALLPVQRFIHRLGPLHQPPAAHKGHFLAGEAGQRDEEAQGAAALAAVHRGFHGQKAAQSLHDCIVPAGGDAGAELTRRREGGGDILAEL